MRITRQIFENGTHQAVEESFVEWVERVEMSKPHRACEVWEVFRSTDRETYKMRRWLRRVNASNHPEAIALRERASRYRRRTTIAVEMVRALADRILTPDTEGGRAFRQILGLEQPL